MTLLYLDTLLTNEARSWDARNWIDRQQSGSFLISSWVRAEFAAALSMKLHRRVVRTSEHAVSLAEFASMQQESLILLPVQDRHFDMAGGLAARSSIGLRAGDALHLAIASDHAATVCTLDMGMAKAGTELGLSVELI